MIVRTVPLPDWLSSTLLDLPPRDPLRILLPTDFPPIHPYLEDDSQKYEPASMLSDQTEPTLVESIQEDPIFAFSHMDDASSTTVDHTAGTLLSHGASSHFALPEEWKVDETNTSSVHKGLPLNNPATTWEFPNASNDGLEYDGSLEATLPMHPSPSASIEQLPFSTPGPSSTITLHYPHHGTSSTLGSLDNDADHLPSASVNGPLMQPRIEESIPSPKIYAPSPRFAFLPASSPSPPYGTQFAEEDIELNSLSLPDYGQQSSLFATHAPGLRVSSPTIPKLFKSPNVAQPVLMSNQSQTHDDRSTLQNPYATPGPRFQFPVTRAVYFDSPTEDPSDSDPLEPLEGYEIQMDELDFKWEPYFTEKGKDVYPKSTAGETPPEESELGVEDRELYPDASCSDGGLRPVANDESSVSQAPDSDDHGPKEVALIIDTHPDEVAFAPAPGIYISPLRNAPQSPEPRQDTEISESRLQVSLCFLTVIDRF